MTQASFTGLVRTVQGLRAVAAFLSVALPVVAMTAIVPGQQRRRRLVRAGASACFTLGGIPVRVRGLEHLPASGCVVVANHASYLDGIILTAALPPRFAFVIKREMTRVPLAHFLLRRIGSEFVERFDHRRRASDARRILRQAGARQALAFFPEGTFVSEPGLQRFHSGAFVAAARGGLPVVPVAIRGSRAVLPAGASLPRPGPIDVIVTAALPVPGAEPVPQLLAAARARILAELDEPDVT